MSLSCTTASRVWSKDVVADDAAIDGKGCNVDGLPGAMNPLFSKRYRHRRILPEDHYLSTYTSNISTISANTRSNTYPFIR